MMIAKSDILQPPLSIATMARAAYDNAIKKGFHSNSDGTMKTPNVGEKTALIHSEVSEAMEEMRKNTDPRHTYYREDGKPEGFIFELADIVIRVGDTCGAYNIIDMLEAAIIEKMTFNATRPHMHGKKF